MTDTAVPAASTARARNPLAFLEAEVEDLRAKGLFRRLRVVESEQKSRCVIDGHEVITLSSNNYLGLNTHPRLRTAAIEAIERYGAGSGAVRTIAGTMSLHEELEARLADFKHVEAVLTFQSGFTCNTGVIPILAPDGAVIVSDALNHASIIDGIRLTKAERKIFPHADMEGLRSALREVRDAPGGAERTVLVITDGVFSMDGDIAQLPAIVEAAEEAEAIVYVDDAHASGVLGRNGRGSIDHFDLHGRVHVQVGTLSKAIGVLGGYVAGPAVLRTMLEHRARPVPLLDLASARRGGSLPGRDRRAGVGAGAHRAAVGEQPLLQGRPRAAGLRHRRLGDADHPDHRRLRRARHEAVRPALRGGRLRAGHRLPDRAG